VEQREVLESMGRFGFHDREARLFLLLLHQGRATAREITRAAGIDRVVAYRTLDSMRARGLVQITAERPRRYVALSPTVLFERSLTERRRALEEDVALAHSLAEQLPALTQTIVDGSPRFQLITGSAAVYPILREALTRAQKEVCAMLTFRSFRESAGLRTFEALSALLRRGGKFRMILEQDPRLPAALRRFDAARRKYPGISVRTLDAQRARITVIDRSEALVFIVPETGHRSVDEIAMWTDTPDFATAQQAYFDRAWETARPLEVPTAGRSRAPAKA
jgi:sugar-specific transcriptional regulator TrmB